MTEQIKDIEDKKNCSCNNQISLLIINYLSGIYIFFKLGSFARKMWLSRDRYFVNMFHCYKVLIKIHRGWWVSILLFYLLMNNVLSNRPINDDSSL